MQYGPPAFGARAPQTDVPETGLAGRLQLLAGQVGGFIALLPERPAASPEWEQLQ